MSIYRKFTRDSLSDIHAKPLPRDNPAGDAATASQPQGTPGDEPPPMTVAWAVKLPRGVRPLALLRAFPRIANFLAANWSDEKAVRPYLDELFVDQRGNRQGFPPEVIAELFALRSYYEDRHPALGKTWENQFKRG